MSIDDIIGISCLIVFLAMFPVGFMRHWRGERRRDSMRLYAFLPVSYGTKRAFRRATTVNLMAIFLLLVGGGVVFGLEAAGRPLPETLAMGIVVTVLVAAGIAVLVLNPTIMLFNWPKTLVAPPYRHEMGVIAARRRRRQVERARDLG